MGAAGVVYSAPNIVRPNRQPAMTILIYQGHQATITFDADANLFHCEVANLRDVITFQARSEADLSTALAESIVDNRAVCKARGEAPQQP